MANIKITELPELTTPVGADLFEIVDDTTGAPTSKKISLTNIKTFINAVGGFYDAYVLVSHQETSGTNGGTFTAGSWQTRPLNTEDSDTVGIASISSNQLTLEAGTYDCFCNAVINQVSHNKMRLYDTTGTAVLVASIVSNGTATDNNTPIPMEGTFTLSVQSVLEVQGWCLSTQASNGFGGAWGAPGVNNIYMQMTLRRRA